MDINFQEIASLLLPRGETILFDILLYIVFFVALFALFTMPDKNMLPTLLVATVLMMSIIAKLSLASPDPILNRREFGFFFINVMIFVIPLVVAGMVRSASSRTSRKSPPTIPLSIIAGFFGGIYFFLFWVFFQR